MKKKKKKKINTEGSFSLYQPDPKYLGSISTAGCTQHTIKNYTEEWKSYTALAFLGVRVEHHFLKFYRALPVKLHPCPGTCLLFQSWEPSSPRSCYLKQQILK